MKKLFSVLLICLLAFFFTGCKKKGETGVLFYSHPVTQDNVLHSSQTFEAGKRIYYLFYSQKKLKNEFIRVQLFKAADNVPRGGYSVLWANDHRVMRQNAFYYYDNFTVYQSGRYVLQVFSTDDISKPIAWNYFYVK